MRKQKRWIKFKNRGHHYGNPYKHIKMRDHELIELVGNPEGLTALRDAIDRALQSPPKFQTRVRVYDIIGGTVEILVKARRLSDDTESQRKSQ